MLLFFIEATWNVALITIQFRKVGKLLKQIKSDENVEQEGSLVLVSILLFY